MPYRRLPNTDSARLKSLKSAHARGKDLPPFKLAFSPSSLRQIQAILPGFENAIYEHRNSLNLQSEKNKEYQKRLKKVKLYISHFIQVVHMSLSRGEIPECTLTFFGLEDCDRKVPSLSSEEEIIQWGKTLIDGEHQRGIQGLHPITNPTIALLKVHYDKFMEYHHYQNSLKKRSQRAQEELNIKRGQVDGIIQQIWNEVEGTFNDLPEDLKREKSSEYGLVYVFRKNELNNANVFQSPRMGGIG